MKSFRILSQQSTFVRARVIALGFVIFFVAVLIALAGLHNYYKEFSVLVFAMSFCIGVAVTALFIGFIKFLEGVSTDFVASNYRNDQAPKEPDIWNDETKEIDYVEGGEGTSIYNPKKSETSLDEYGLNEEEILRRSKTMQRWQNEHNHP